MREVQRLNRSELDEPSELRARLAIFEQTLGALEPTQCHGETVAHRVVEDQIDGETRAAAFLVDGDALRERALAELDACVPIANPHGRFRGSFEVIELEWSFCIDEPVRLEGVLPAAAVERRPSVGEKVIVAPSAPLHALILSPR